VRLPREEVVAGYAAELEQFETLIRSLPEEAWNRPSRCEGWTVGDVAAHVVGTITDIVEGRFDGLGTPEGIEQTVAERRGRSPGELADELEKGRQVGGALLAGFDDDAWRGPALGGVQGTIGDGVETLWYDTYVHADDIRAAAGLPSERGAGLRASVLHLADLLTANGWGPATLALDGLEPVAVGGGGPEVSGDPLVFVLAATGRADPAALGLDETVNVYR
jgi:uncharacterized protein (TIGR03083 family)